MSKTEMTKTRKIIVNAAITLMNESGFHETTMNEIAKRAKIGPGTLYRHFPTRDELLATVYITEVEKLAAAQKKLSAELPPIEALRAWLLVFIDYIAAKKIIAPALNAMAGGRAADNFSCAAAGFSTSVMWTVASSSSRVGKWR